MQGLLSVKHKNYWIQFHWYSICYFIVKYFNFVWIFNCKIAVCKIVLQKKEQILIFVSEVWERSESTRCNCTCLGELFSVNKLPLSFTAGLNINFSLSFGPPVGIVVLAEFVLASENKQLMYFDFALSLLTTAQNMIKNEEKKLFSTG